MKKSLSYLCLSIVLISGQFILTNIQNPIYAEKNIPSYAKWSKIAIKETIRKYPNAQVIDYLHKGRQNNGESTTEKFKLWLKGKNREFGVFVNIEYNTKTEEILHITMLETDR